MNIIKQSTAATIVLGPFVDDTDGKTAETALGLVQADVRLSKNGGTFAQKGDATAPAHMENGHYNCVLNTTDTDTLGRLRVAVSKTGALPVWRDFDVVPAVVHDTLVAGTGSLRANVIQWTGTNVATPDTAGHPKVTLKTGTGTGELAVTSGAVKAQSGLRKNQALANFPFLMTDSTNHNPMTGLTVSATRSIDGAAFAAGAISGMTEVSNGMYQCDLAAGDMNGDTVALRFTATGADDLIVTLITEPA